MQPFKESANIALMSPSNHSFKTYQTRVNQAIDYIHRHLEQSIRLEDVAAAGCFSPFHFHRIFKGLLGETVNDYIIRLRCEWAVNLLQSSPHYSITEIAFQCGYSSSANLAKSLKKQYYLTATQIRNGALLKKSKIGKKNSKMNNVKKSAPGYALNSNSNPGPGSYSGKQKEKTMQIQIKSFPKTRVAYVRSQTGYKEDIISRSWEQLMRWAGPRELLTPQTIALGISWDDPDVTPKNKCRYDAAISIPDDYQVTGDINTQEIPALKCAILHFEGKTSELKRVYDQFYSEWLPQSGYQPGNFPPFEVCLNDHDKHPQKFFILDIHLPIKPI